MKKIRQTYISSFHALPEDFERHTEPFSKVDGDIVFCMFGFTPVILTRDASLVKMLLNSKKATIPVAFHGASCVLGEGLILSEG